MAKTLNKKQKQVLNRYPEAQSAYQLPNDVMDTLRNISPFENLESDVERYLNVSFLYRKAQGL